MRRLALPSLLLLLLAGAVATLRAADPLPAPTGIKPSPALITYAAAHNIPLDGFELADKDEPARPDDRLTVLFTLQDGADSRQWVGEFRSVTLTEREAKSKPGTGLGILGVFQSTLHTDTEHSYKFEQIPVALEILTHGPFSGGTESTDVPPATITARVLATRDYLAHGLAPMCEIELRLRAAGKKNPGLSYMFRPKYSEKQLAATKARAAEAGFTEEDERVYAEGFFALVQFGNLSFLTKGIDTITHEMADAPSLFSGAFTNLDWNRMELVDGTPWGLPDTRIFRVPYHFLSKTKAKGSFFVTAPRPPLQNIAGVVGLTVDETSKTPGKRLIMRVLAGRKAAH